MVQLESKMAEKNEKSLKVRKKYVAPAITHEDAFARTSLAGCGMASGSGGSCGACPNSAGPFPPCNP